jgi:hypothetical protein
MCLGSLCTRGSEGDFRAHTTPPRQLSNLTALLPPIAKLIRNQEETVRYIKKQIGA